MAFDEAPLSVSEVNRRARLAVEGGLPLLWVVGEVSGFTRAPSGHWYFTLRDATASVRCAMFRNRNQFVDWQPVNGSQVEVRAQPTLYEARGEFQLTVEVMRHAGLGALYEALARLKARLEQEGLFDPARKRPLPVMPLSIGVVTSARAAALRDVLITLRRRWPLARVLVYPTAVQGEGAGTAIATRIREAGAAGLCQLLLVVRGGGSMQDLWAFNEEAVVRAIAACPVPVVSGVGHETDFCLADFAADLRAPTPTGAAQMATPDGAELLGRVGQRADQLAVHMRRRLHLHAQRLDTAAARLRHPAQWLATQTRQVDQLARRLDLAQRHRLRTNGAALDLLASRLRGTRPRPAALGQHLEQLRERLAVGMGVSLSRRAQRLAALTDPLGHLNPEAVLARGYSITRDASGRVITDCAQVTVGDALTLTLRKGEVTTRVEDLRRD
jgi:exodeoxyribonuclease VII large subunit